VLLVTLAGGVIAWLYVPDVIFPVAALFALFSVAAHTRPQLSLPALAGVLGVTALSLITAPAEDVAFAMVVAVVVWALGEAARNRRVAIAEATRRAVGEEQTRIARELHGSPTACQ
jgi:signal transduction histidine kinase